jgi:hypothetical protein
MSRELAAARVPNDSMTKKNDPIDHASVAKIRKTRPRAAAAPLREAVAVASLVATLLGSVEPASAAGNPLNSSERPRSDTTAPRPPGGHNDFTIVPVAGGTTDIGIGGGFFAALTRNEAGYTPFAWNLEAAGFVSFLVKDRTLVLPYTDVYSKLTVMRFLGGPLQLELRPSFTDEATLDYYGMGNAAASVAPAGRGPTYFEYGRIHPELLADVRFKILDHVAGRVGLRYVETWLAIPADSKLGEDLRGGSPEVRALIGPTGTEGAALFRYGLQFDDRDNEVSPHKGTFDEVAFNWSPGGIPALPFRYGEASVNLRGYVPLFSKRVTLAARVVGDVLFGDVPFYELSRAVDTYAIGGSNGVRGVPAQRYYGKVKVFGNVEVRARLFDFHAFGKALTVGAAGFLDGGRVWADTTPHPELDGTALGLKYGAGGGLRLMSGTAFVLRADVAWSPDAAPVGGYVVAGESF